MDLFPVSRTENIKMLAQAIVGDEYCDTSQLDVKQEDYAPSGLLNFVKRNAGGHTLECGPGSGWLIRNGVGVDVMVEPSNTMREALTEWVRDVQNVEKIQRHPAIYAGVTECLPAAIHDASCDTVIFVNGFFQVRSDYESLIEFNRVLKHHGRLIINILVHDEHDIICGRVLGFDNYVRVIKEFGFQPVELRRESGFICMEKVAEFNPAMLRKLQLVKRGDLYEVRNFYQPRDGHLL